MYTTTTVTLPPPAFFRHVTRVSSFVSRLTSSLFRHIVPPPPSRPSPPRPPRLLLRAVTTTATTATALLPLLSPASRRQQQQQVVPSYHPIPSPSPSRNCSATDSLAHSAQYIRHHELTQAAPLVLVAASPPLSPSRDIDATLSCSDKNAVPPPSANNHPGAA